MTRMRIVLAEDEPRILNFLKQKIPELDRRFQVIAAYPNGREALAGILALGPDLVITDIRMPHVNGLDLIRLAKEGGSRAEFVVLSGYGDHEYARQAIRNKAADYLLKPIDIRQLQSVLGALGDKACASRRADLLETLRGCCAGEAPSPQAELPEEIRIMSAFAGPLVRRMYGAMSEGTRAWQSPSFSLSASAAEAAGSMFFSFSGYHANEHIFCLMGGDLSQDAILRSTRAIRGEMAACALPLNFFITERVSSLREILPAMQNLYAYLREYLRFGQDGVFFVPDDFAPAKPASLSEPLYALADELAAPRQEETRRALQAICGALEREKPPQFELQNYLAYLLSRLAAAYPSQKDFLPTAEEILCDAQSFGDIFSSLLEVFGAGAQPDGKIEKPLVRSVKEYLEEHYTKSLTYRDLYDAFGYNEKYIATLFKREMGVSPVKYVVHLRIEKAKRLIFEHPDWMLKQVAQTVGYDDPLYFSKVFREVEAMSPSAYAETLQRRAR